MAVGACKVVQHPRCGFFRQTLFLGRIVLVPRTNHVLHDVHRVDTVVCSMTYGRKCCANHDMRVASFPPPLGLVPSENFGVAAAPKFAFKQHDVSDGSRVGTIATHCGRQRFDIVGGIWSHPGGGDDGCENLPRGGGVTEHDGIGSA